MTSFPGGQDEPGSPTPPAMQLPLPRRIVLTGFMGSGKTTVGRLLARELNWCFLDADAVIEEAAGAPIAQLFLDRGEAWFRETEHQTIRSLLHPSNPEHSGLVLALGGGAIEDERTRRLLLTSEGTQLIHLEASLPTVLIRCQGTESLRPVFSDQANLHARYERRLPLYRESHITIPVDTLTPAAVAKAILAQFTLPSG